MYGNDIEKLLGVICAINNESAKQIELLSYDSDYRFMTINHTHNVHIGDETESAGGPVPHIHGISQDVTGGPEATGAVGIPNYVSNQLTYPEEYTKDDQGEQISPYIIYEKEFPKEANTYIKSLIILGNQLQGDIINVKKIEAKSYIKVTGVHNGYGSPYTEIYDLKKKIDICNKYAKQHPRLQWLGEKHTLLNLIQMVMTTSIDAKFALIVYQDYLQKGYNSIINKKKPHLS
jgi:hypothetical protein